MGIKLSLLKYYLCFMPLWCVSFNT